MEFGFDYGTLITRCRMLSSYEAAEMTDGEGESRYPEARIVSQDEPLVKGFLTAAALAVEESIAHVVDSASHTGDGFTWNLRLGTRWRGSERELRRYVEEALADYAMAQWLAKKGNGGRSAVYLSVWNDMLARCISMTFRISAPVKEKERAEKEREEKDEG